MARHRPSAASPNRPSRHVGVDTLVIVGAVFKRLAFAALLAVLVGTVDWTVQATQSGAQAASANVPPASAGVLLFVKGNDLWSMKADGSGQAQLTHQANGKFANHGLFSPDGSKIVYASHTPWTPQSTGSSEIHLMNADGS